jgi:phospholipase/carboxylesterase
MTDPTKTSEARGSQSGLTYRFREPTDTRVPPVILLHGLYGDEKVMWILDQALPKGGFVAAPRAPFALQSSGYSWVESYPGLERAAYQPAQDRLCLFLDDLDRVHNIKRNDLLYMGFSQGGALALSAMTSVQTRPAGVIVAAGFLPEGDFSEAAGMEIYWAHGTLDETIPVDRASRDVDRLLEAGACVSFCKTAVGHKLGIECLRGIRNWIRTNFMDNPDQPDPG